MERSGPEPADGGATSIESQGSKPLCSFDPETGFLLNPSTFDELRWDWIRRLSIIVQLRGGLSFALTRPTASHRWGDSSVGQSSGFQPQVVASNPARPAEHQHTQVMRLILENFIANE